jgi:hypothetical protein
MGVISAREAVVKIGCRKRIMVDILFWTSYLPIFNNYCLEMKKQDGRALA